METLMKNYKSLIIFLLSLFASSLETYGTRYDADEINTSSCGTKRSRETAENEGEPPSKKVCEITWFMPIKPVQFTPTKLVSPVADDLINHILSFFNNNDQDKYLNDAGKSLVFSLNNALRDHAMTLYTEKNTNFHKPWHSRSNLDLPNARILYIFNGRMVRLLGLFNNLSIGYVTDTDRREFFRLHAKIVSVPRTNNLPSLPLKYAEYLTLHEKCLHPAPFANTVQNNLQTLKHKKLEEISDELTTVASMNDSALLPNETALYFHFSEFVGNDLQPRQHSLFSEVTSHLMQALTLNLKNLKTLIPPATADHWEQIIDLEPLPTLFELQRAAASHEVAKKYLEEARYREKSLKFLEAFGEKPLFSDYRALSIAFLQAGKTTIPGQKAGCFVQSAGYCETGITIALKKHATLYHDIALVCFKAGKATTLPDRRAGYFEKAAEYSEKSVTIKQQEQKAITGDDYRTISTSYFLAGTFSTEKKDKITYYERGMRYCFLAAEAHQLNKDIKGLEKLVILCKKSLEELIRERVENTELHQATCKKYETSLENLKKGL
jgi:hypothetical protein